jgi:hypothetical protein
MINMIRRGIADQFLNAIFRVQLAYSIGSLSEAGGNITGYSIVSTELDAKRLTLLHELLPTARRIGVLVNAANSTFEIAREETNACIDRSACNRLLLTLKRPRPAKWRT